MELDKFYYGQLDEITSSIASSTSLTKKEFTLLDNSGSSTDTSITNITAQTKTNSTNYFDYSLPTSPLDAISSISSTTVESPSITTPTSTSPLTTTESLSFLTPTSVASFTSTSIGITKQFQCSQCPLSFRRNHDLKRHVKIHLPVRPYTCEQCSKAFNRKDALRRHIISKACKMGFGRAEKLRSETLVNSHKSNNNSHFSIHKNGDDKSNKAISKNTDHTSGIKENYSKVNNISNSTDNALENISETSFSLEKQLNNIPLPLSSLNVSQPEPDFMNLNYQPDLDSLESYFLSSVTTPSINDSMTSSKIKLSATAMTSSTSNSSKISISNTSITTKRNSSLSPFTITNPGTPASTPISPAGTEAIALEPSNSITRESSNNDLTLAKLNSVPSEWSEIYNLTDLTQSYQTQTRDGNQQDTKNNFWGSPWI